MLFVCDDRDKGIFEPALTPIVASRGERMHGMRHGILHAIPRRFLHGIRCARLLDRSFICLCRAKTSISRRGTSAKVQAKVRRNDLKHLFFSRLFSIHVDGSRTLFKSSFTGYISVMIFARASLSVSFFFLFLPRWLPRSCSHIHRG